MKKISFIILGLIGLVSCRSQYPTHFKVNRLEGSFNDISVKNDTFYYVGQPIASYTNMELECLESNCVLEISVAQFTSGFNDTTQVLMKYLHTQHPHSKIEVKVK
jgi:hypothetical protein